jgi:hypothetical protein
MGIVTQAGPLSNPQAYMLRVMHGLSWFSNSDEVRFMLAEVLDLRQRIFTSVFPKLAAQRNFLRHFFTPDIIATLFLPVFAVFCDVNLP